MLSLPLLRTQECCARCCSPQLNPRQALQPAAPELAWSSLDAQPDRTALLELLLRLPATPAAGAGGSTGSGGGSYNTGGGGTAGWHELRLSLDYRAAFPSAFDHAPDASRGVDVPPAVATLLPPGCAHAASAADLLPDSSHAAGGDAGSGAEAGGGAAQPALLRRLRARAGCGVQRAHGGAAGGGPGGGCVVPLPLPDFSMPFNVVCFTSTLLAVLLGGVANVVLRRAGWLGGCVGCLQQGAFRAAGRSHGRLPARVPALAGWHLNNNRSLACLAAGAPRSLQAWRAPAAARRRGSARRVAWWRCWR